MRGFRWFPFLYRVRVNIWASLFGLDHVTVRFGKPIYVTPSELPSRRRSAYHAISSEVMLSIGNLRPRRRITGPPRDGIHT